MWIVFLFPLRMKTYIYSPLMEFVLLYLKKTRFHFILKFKTVTLLSFCINLKADLTQMSLAYCKVATIYTLC